MNKSKPVFSVAVATALSCSCANLASAASTHIVPPIDIDLIGQLRYSAANPDETLVDVTARHRLGQNEIKLANASLDRWQSGIDEYITLPTQYILPQSKRQGIVLNLPEYRLYHYQSPTQVRLPVVTTYAVSIGSLHWETPLGITSVISKQQHPAWIPPESIKKEALLNGHELPDIVPPGPDNPLGDYALRLALPGYLLHGTNRPLGIGMRVTHGCIRLYPKDIERLFYATSAGTTVNIVNQPVKVGWFANQLYLEVHPPLMEDNLSEEDMMLMAITFINNKLDHRPHKIRTSLIRTIVRQQKGIPTLISVQ